MVLEYASWFSLSASLESVYLPLQREVLTRFSSLLTVIISSVRELTATFTLQIHKLQMRQISLDIQFVLISVQQRLIQVLDAKLHHMSKLAQPHILILRLLVEPMFVYQLVQQALSLLSLNNKSTIQMLSKFFIHSQKTNGSSLEHGQLLLFLIWFTSN